MTTPAASGSRPAPVPTVQEFSIRVPKNSRKRHNVMRFNATLNVDISKWTQVKMERENNAREYKGYDEDMPKFGAGSEFGRDAREEARRKKFGMIARKYKPEDQPWVLKTGGKTGKKFKGIREGGISENAAYYVFTHAPDGAIEAFPLQEWYNFQPIQRYKTLSAEEAELEFGRRVKTINYWSLMARKRWKKDEEANDEEPEANETGKGKKTAKKEKELKISEMDEWMSSDDDDDDESGSDKDKKKKKDSDEEDDKKKKKKKPTKKKKKVNSDDEAFEESDDGDEEGRECEYISDSTDSEDEKDQTKEIQSVAEEDALRKLLVSDEDDDEENNEDKKDDDEFDDEEAKDQDKAKEADKKKDKDKKKKKKIKKKDPKKNSKDSSASDASSDSGSDSDAPKEVNGKKSASAHNSRSPTPTAAPSGSDTLKRKLTSSPELSQAKKMKPETPVSHYVPATPLPGSSEGITEDAVRRYLMRKPMTTTELLQKFKSKKTGLTSDQLVNVMTQILKKINPTKQTIKSKMYLSIKAQPH
ncbi:general transcription factor IIF subunit 1 [Microplitis mediator]|uniref:general transcription factor IIF subunit 1 n=1 Tax=Microplitis mediator TaxID=375433 RepID=UPI002555A2B9|nr:general transcription factor IIF subunit 1 [Microplitis mediator]